MGSSAGGFVAREQCRSDRRVSYAVLTKAGRDKLREADRSHTRQIRELMCEHYDDGELTQIAALLDRVGDVGSADDAARRVLSPRKLTPQAVVALQGT